MSDLAERVAAESIGFLRDTYVPRLATALEALPEGDLWWRPHPDVIAFGTIMLHLEGNVRQWICSGLGDLPDHRDRASEFTAEDGPAGPELLARLSATIDEACTVIESMDEARLLAEFTIQGFATSGLNAVYHVVEHFSWHTGQITSIAKQRAGEQHGLAFYDEAKVNAARNEPNSEPA